MSNKASDHDVYEHIHTYEHLITSCKKEISPILWERRDEFFCTECLDIKVKVRRDEGVWQPQWWIRAGDIR